MAVGLTARRDSLRDRFLAELPVLPGRTALHQPGGIRDTDLSRRPGDKPVFRWITPAKAKRTMSEPERRNQRIGWDSGI